MHTSINNVESNHEAVSVFEFGSGNALPYTYATVYESWE